MNKKADKKKRAVELKESVLRFFLHIYRLQLGARSDAEGEFSPLPIRRSKADQTYDLRVKKENDWRSRRMSIAALGDGGGSKSTCFKVIYDDVFVIKIPPAPITDFDEYIEAINAERRIADKMVPDVECIAPAVAGLLKKIPPFSGKSDLPADKFEIACIRYLKKNPDYQEYLKIDGAFVFVMTLSKYAFFSSVIERMHDKEREIDAEIGRSAGILWDMLAFEERYGTDNSHIFDGMNTVYAKVEQQIADTARRHEIPPSVVQTYQKKEWFLKHLAGKDIWEDEKGFSPAFIKELNTALRKLIDQRQDEVENFRTIIKGYIEKRTFEKNRATAKGVITNLLILLSWLKIKGVALRDLKPDNLFVVGDPDFLPSAEAFSLGLIDFETAVYCRARSAKAIEQPLLAATPSYGTPSHLFENQVIEGCLGNLPRILQLQDWMAMIVMIYTVVIGERLFRNTVTRLSRIGAQIRDGSPDEMADIFKTGSWSFWRVALWEFEERLEANGEKLRAVEIRLPENAKKLLGGELIEQRAQLIRETRLQIENQQVFRSKNIQSELIRASQDMINRCWNNWMEGVNVPEAPEEVRREVVRFLTNLKELKQKTERVSATIHHLREESPAISVHTLLQLMFHVVLDAMYRLEWGELRGGISEALSPEGGNLPEGEETVVLDEASLEETISYEHTITYERSRSSPEKPD